jgi:hypothetical protein
MLTETAGISVINLRDKIPHERNIQMKITRPLSLAFAVCALCLARVDLQAVPIPFNAFSSGTFTAVGIPPEDVLVHIDHPSVVAAPFPFVSLVADERVDFTTLPPSVRDGTFTFTCPQGFLLEGAFVGVLLPVDPVTGLYQVTGPFTFTGGTGLFTGAAGGGLLDAMVQFLDPQGAFGVSEIQWQGTLELLACPCPDGGLTLGFLGLAVACLGGLRRAIRK